MNLRHRTKAQKETEIMSTPEKVRLREEAAARCTAEIKRRVLRRQARKARAEHLVRCILDPRKEKSKKKAADRIVRKRSFTEDRADVLGKRGYQDGVRRGKAEARGPRSWTITIHMDGSLQLSCVRCRG